MTDHACREIRLRRMTREQGIEMVEKYVNKKPKNLNLFLKWIGITENSFYYLINQHRNKKIWKRNKVWEWELTYNYNNSLSLTENVNRLELKEEFSEFILTEKKTSSDSKNKYILIGKGV